MKTLYAQQQSTRWRILYTLLYNNSRSPTSRRRRARPGIASPPLRALIRASRHAARLCRNLPRFKKAQFLLGGADGILTPLREERPLLQICAVRALQGALQQLHAPPLGVCLALRGAELPLPLCVRRHSPHLLRELHAIG